MHPVRSSWDDLESTWICCHALSQRQTRSIALGCGAKKGFTKAVGLWTSVTPGCVRSPTGTCELVPSSSYEMPAWGQGDGVLWCNSLSGVFKVVQPFNPLLLSVEKAVMYSVKQKAGLKGRLLIIDVWSGETLWKRGRIHCPSSIRNNLLLSGPHRQFFCLWFCCLKPLILALA